jgi:cob(I)alamin adenosyltransferase
MQAARESSQMANRLSKIITRTGDDGSTGLGDGTRTRKDAARIQVLGDVDELNSAIGLLLVEPLDGEVRVTLTRIQNQLFDLGGEICIPGHRAISDAQVTFLDETTCELNATLPPLKEFILPGGSRQAALCHVARTVARRAERSLVALHGSEPVSPQSRQYLNRLSDFLFVLARTLNRQAGASDSLWQREPAPDAPVV